LPIGREYPQNLRTWVWKYNQNLIAKDKLPVGQQHYDRLLDAAPYPINLRTWLGIAVPQVAVALPFNQEDWPNPRAALQPGRSWTASYNLNLIGRDALPVGQQHYDRPLDSAPYPTSLRTWIGEAIPQVAADRPFVQEDWPTPRPIAQPDRSFTRSFNLNLIARDQLPVGKQVTDLPPREALRATDLRTWINRVNLALTTQAAALPFNEYDWPNPRGPAQPLRGWIDKFNLNLIAQDQLPVGSFHTDLPPQGPARAVDLRTWINTVNLALTTQPAALPFNQYNWPNPRGPEQPLRGWLAKYNENLIGQDVLPVGSFHTDLPPQGAVPINDLRTWINRVNLALTQAAALPFNQFDWPVRLGPAQPDRSFTVSFNRNLIGQDQFPIRQMDWPLTRIVPQPDRTFVAFYNRNLIGRDQLPVGSRVTDLPPVGHIYPNALRSFSHSPNPPAPVEPVIDRVSSMPFIATPGQLKSW